MKFLIDQNLPPRLAGVLADKFPGSRHVIHLRLDRSSDHVIWRYAFENDFAIMTQDDDFQQLSMLKGAPPKVVFLQNAQGNAAQLAEFVALQVDGIHHFMCDREASLMVIRR
jgi:predicted nuclease of predicted toxin-antitoxin system